MADNRVEIETRYGENNATSYRFFWDGPDGTVAGPWRDSREQAYREGETYLTTGKIYG